MTAPTRTEPTRATRGRSDATLERRRSDTAPQRRRDGPARREHGTAPAPEKPEPTPARAARPLGRGPACLRAPGAARGPARSSAPADEDLDRGAGRASFVVLIIVLLAVGVAATLWLSTQAIADSYRLEDAKQQADQLAERADQLQRDVTKAESASVAGRAREGDGHGPGRRPGPAGGASRTAGWSSSASRRGRRSRRHRRRRPPRSPPTGGPRRRGGQAPAGQDAPHQPANGPGAG